MQSLNFQWDGGDDQVTAMSIDDSNPNRKYKRKTNAENVKELQITGALKPRLVDEHGLSTYIGVAVGTLQNTRGMLPKKWTSESLKAAMEKGFVSPPVTSVGGKKMYDLNLVDKWVALLPVMGQLPEEIAQ